MTTSLLPLPILTPDDYLRGLSLLAPVLTVVVTAVIVLILDLHEPRQGLIRDNLEPLRQLRSSMN